MKETAVQLSFKSELLEGKKGKVIFGVKASLSTFLLFSTLLSSFITCAYNNSGKL